MSTTPEASVEAALECAGTLGVDPGPDFWKRYFAASPEAEGRMVHMDEYMRGRMLASVFDLLMIEDEEERRAFLAFEIGNHDAYGARLAMYEALFPALQEALRDVCADAWDPAWDLAWSRRVEELLRLISGFARRD